MTIEETVTIAEHIADLKAQGWVITSTSWTERVRTLSRGDQTIVIAGAKDSPISREHTPVPPTGPTRRKGPGNTTRKLR